MVRRLCITLLLAVMTIPIAFLHIIISQAWHSAYHSHSDRSTANDTCTINTTKSSVVDDATNGSLNVSEFLVEYEKYCSSQLIPKSSNVVVTAAGVACRLCPCVPHTLGKWYVYLAWMMIRDVVLGLGPWSLVVLKDKISVLGPGLGLEPSVLGPVLGLVCWVLGPGLGLACWVLGPGLERQVLGSVTTG